MKTRSPLVRFCVLLPALLACPPRVAAGSLVATANSPTPFGTGFGDSVALDAGRLAIGATQDVDPADEILGRAYLADPATGQLLLAIDDAAGPPEGFAAGLFGSSVALSGETLVVGAPSESRVAPVASASQGRAYVFDAATGALVQALDDPTPTTRDGFGSAVAAADGLVLVGAPGDDTTGFFAGQAHLFDAATGALLQTFDDPSPEANGGFGAAVAIDAGWVLIGAEGDDSLGPGVGQAYLFDAATGALLQTLDDPTPIGGDGFGVDVALRGGLALIGASGDSTLAPGVGQAHLFDAATGDLIRTLDPPSTASGRFGGSVDLAGGLAVVGAADDASAGPFVGRAYVYDTATGDLLQALDDPTPEAFDGFGTDVAIDGTLVAVGDRGAGALPGALGQVHVFRVVPEPSSLLLAGVCGGAWRWRRRSTARR